MLVCMLIEVGSVGARILLLNCHAWGRERERDIFLLSFTRNCVVPLRVCGRLCYFIDALPVPSMQLVSMQVLKWSQVNAEL